MITRNCTQGLFLLRSDPVTANAFIYCMGVAQMRSHVDVMGLVQMSNHLHDDIFDRHGTAPIFYRESHGLLAKCLNARWGRWENFFASTQTNVVHLRQREDLIRSSSTRSRTRSRMGSSRGSRIGQARTVTRR